MDKVVNIFHVYVQLLPHLWVSLGFSMRMQTPMDNETIRFMVFYIEPFVQK